MNAVVLKKKNEGRGKKKVGAVSGMSSGCIFPKLSVDKDGLVERKGSVLAEIKKWEQESRSNLDFGVVPFSAVKEKGMVSSSRLVVNVGSTEEGCGGWPKAATEGP